MAEKVKIATLESGKFAFVEAAEALLMSTKSVSKLLDNTRQHNWEVRTENWELGKTATDTSFVRPRLVGYYISWHCGVRFPIVCWRKRPHTALSDDNWLDNELISRAGKTRPALAGAARALTPNDCKLKIEHAAHYQFKYICHKPQPKPKHKHRSQQPSQTANQPNRQIRRMYLNLYKHMYTSHTYLEMWTAVYGAWTFEQHLQTHRHRDTHTHEPSGRQQLHLCDAPKTNSKIWSVAAARCGRWQVAGGNGSQALPTSANVAV